MEEPDHVILDHDRTARTGVPEVIFCQGKTPAQVVDIVARMLEREGRVLATRADTNVAEEVARAFSDASYHPLARVLVVDRRPRFAPAGQTVAQYVAVVSAGTSDIPVAEEAALTLEFLGARAERVFDVGVAGIHRLLGRVSVIEDASYVIVVAGMEGALPSVIAGLVSCPMVAVPTSVGYGASFGGLAALLAMLNSCAPGLAVVNIDNGFGAAVHAYKVLMRMRK